MRVYLAIKYHEDHSNQDRIAAISSALVRNVCETFCVARDLEQWGVVHFSPEVLMQKSFDAIDASDVVVVDLTEKGVGVGIEAGYAFAKQIPIITIARADSDISDTLRGISRAVFLYATFDELAGFLVRRFKLADAVVDPLNEEPA